jgi:5-methylcytosine-specific restriction endonuclease McrA
MPSEKLPTQLSTEILVRDSAACVYCLATDVALSVDHIRARSWGGGNEHDNLVLSCKTCNDAKGNMDAEAFAGMIVRYRDSLPALARFGTATREEILARVETARKRPLDPVAVKRALDLIRAQRR